MNNKTPGFVLMLLWLVPAVMNLYRVAFGSTIHPLPKICLMWLILIIMLTSIYYIWYKKELDSIILKKQLLVSFPLYAILFYYSFFDLIGWWYHPYFYFAVGWVVIIFLILWIILMPLLSRKLVKS